MTNIIAWDTSVLNFSMPTIHIQFSGKSSDEEIGILSDTIIVRQSEIYSASIYCKTSDYTLFNGTDPQVTLYIYGYANATLSSPQIIGSIGINKANFPAQDWFRIKLENISIPSGVHYIALYATIKRNGNIWFSYPCIELGNTVSDYEPYETDISEYYNSNIYDGILETDELVKTENITFNELNEVTLQTIGNFYIITADDEGVYKFETEQGIVADELNESLDFRKQRLINRTTTFLPYTFPFLKEKLDSLLGVGEYNTYIDFANYTVYLEYCAQDAIWGNEVTVMIAGMKPCNMVFRTTPIITSLLNISEQVNLNQVTFNYKMNGSWQLGQHPFADLQDKGIIKMAKFSSVQPILLSNIQDYVATTVGYVIVTDGTTNFRISNFSTKGKGILTYTIPSTCGLSQITNIKVYDIKDNILTNSTVYLDSTQISSSPLIKHNFSATEG